MRATPVGFSGDAMRYIAPLGAGWIFPVILILAGCTTDAGRQGVDIFGGVLPDTNPPPAPQLQAHLPARISPAPPAPPALPPSAETGVKPRPTREATGSSVPHVAPPVAAPRLAPVPSPAFPPVEKPAKRGPVLEATRPSVPAEVPPVVASLPPVPPPAESPARLSPESPEATKPVATPRGRPGYIDSVQARLRPCPEVSRKCEPLAALRLNEEVRVLRPDREGWLFVRVPRLDREGYVQRTLISDTRQVRTAVRPAPRRATPPEPRPSSSQGPSAEPAPQEELIK